MKHKKLFGCLLVCNIFFTLHTYAKPKSYHYSVELGYPEKYPIIFNIVELPTTGNIQDTLYVSTNGANPGPWGSGSQASSILDSQPLPTHIKMQWFSVSENQFWEVDAPINQNFFNQKNNYRVINPFVYFKNEKLPKTFLSDTTWNIYAVPGGKAFIWISGLQNGYESYLIAELQAKTIDIKDWKGFLLHSDTITQNDTVPNRENFVQNQLEKAAKKTNTPVQQLMNKNADQWMNYIKKYNWQMKVESPFTLKDVEARYINKEIRILYADTDQSKLLPRPIPSMLEFFVVNKHTNYLNRLRVTFGRDYYKNHDDDWQEIINAFETINKYPPINGLMTLSFKISPDFKQMDIFLIKGDHKIEIKEPYVELISTYDDYTPIECDNSPPSLQMAQEDFTTNEKGSKIFHITDQLSHPVPYYKYKLLREDGKYYYGVTGMDGNTARVKTFVNGKWLNLDLYKDLREGCVSKEQIPKDLHIYKPVEKPTSSLFDFLPNIFEN